MQVNGAQARAISIGGVRAEDGGGRCPHWILNESRQAGATRDGSKGRRASSQPLEISWLHALRQAVEALTRTKAIDQHQATPRPHAIMLAGDARGKARW